MLMWLSSWTELNRYEVYEDMKANHCLRPSDPSDLHTTHLQLFLGSYLLAKGFDMWLRWPQPRSPELPPKMLRWTSWLGVGLWVVQRGILSSLSNALGCSPALQVLH